MSKMQRFNCESKLAKMRRNLTKSKEAQNDVNLGDLRSPGYQGLLLGGRRLADSLALEPRAQQRIVFLFSAVC